MATRITDKQLDALCDRINKLTKSPQAPYAKNGSGQLAAQVGNFHISRAYGGVCLHRMCNEDGGVTSPLTPGHVPKRELYEQLHAYIRGLEFNTQD